MNSTVNSSLFVCKLTGPELQKRKAALRKEVFSKVRKFEEVEDGFHFCFADREGILERLADYILAERKCCPFFQFELTIKPDKGGVELKLCGPKGAKSMIRELMDDR